MYYIKTPKEKNMKKFLFEILLFILGIVILYVKAPDPVSAAFLQGIGYGMIGLAMVYFLIHILIVRKNKSSTDKKRFPTKRRDNKETAFPTKRRDELPEPKKFSASSDLQITSSSNKEAERKKTLDEQIESLRKETERKILVPDDVDAMLTIRVNLTESNYIYQNLQCPLFDGSVWEVRENIDSFNLSEKQIISLLRYGSERLIDRLVYVATSKSWIMPMGVFDYFCSSNRLMLLKFPCYSPDAFSRLINKMEPYERLGYRTKQVAYDEKIDGSFTNLFTQETISYYEDVSTDVVYVAEQHFSEALRKQAFDIVFAGPCDMTQVIARLDSLTKDEVQALFERGNTDEIDEIIGRNDGEEFIPPKYAIKVVLGVIPSEYSDFIHENFDFESVDHQIWVELFEELTADELAGYRIKKVEKDEEPDGSLIEDGKEDIPYYAEGDHDIMKLIEDHANDDDLRIAALAKVIYSRDIETVIDSLDNISENEAKLIMQVNRYDAVKALLERHDVDEIITNLPDDIAIKIRLELMYPSASENVKDTYSFNNSGAFIKVIEELSPYELLGFREKPDGSDDEQDIFLSNLESPDEEINFYNDVDYDIIKLIEDEMGDDGHLRELAFKKICGAKNMADAIGRWDNITGDEMVAIIARNFPEEIKALINREDFGNDLVEKLPDAFIIKSFLLDEDDDIADEYNNRLDGTKFRQIVEKMCTSLSSAKMTDEEEGGDVSELSDDILIRIFLKLIDLDDYGCSFDKEDVTGEFVDRMENKEGFKNKVQKLVDKLK